LCAVFSVNAVAAILSGRSVFSVKTVTTVLPNGTRHNRVFAIATVFSGRTIFSVNTIAPIFTVATGLSFRAGNRDVLRILSVSSILTSLTALTAFTFFTASAFWTTTGDMHSAKFRVFLRVLSKFCAKVFDLLLQLLKRYFHDVPHAVVMRKR
jgi:hypothetical protein